MSWQRRARVVIAAGAVVVAVAVAFAFRVRPPASTASVERTDATALAEIAGGQHFRWNRNKQEIRVSWERQLTYSNGSSKMIAVTAITTRDGGRDFTVTAKEGLLANGDKDITLEGDLRLMSSDGLVVKSDRGSYATDEGIVRAPGPVTFSRGRLRGSGIGFTFDTKRDVMTILDRVEATFDGEPGTPNAEPMTITASTAELNRVDHLIRFDRSVRTTRAEQVILADNALAHLSEDEQVIEVLDLRGNSSVTAPPGEAGSLQALTGRDMDLKYGPDGQTLERIAVVGNAVMQLANERGRPARKIAASTLDVTFGPDGSTPTTLAARERAEVELPSGVDRGPTRIVKAESFDAAGQDGRGLTGGRFTGDVRFTEIGSGVERTARSGVLDVKMAEGLGALDDARFSQGVRFDDQETRAIAAEARYLIDTGVLELSGSAPGFERPRVSRPDLSVTATRLDVTFPPAPAPGAASGRGASPPAESAAKARPSLRGSGNVTSEVPPRDKNKGKGQAASEPAAKLPSMLKSDQTTLLVGEEFVYDGAKSAATYTGSARLLQGDTSIEAKQLVLDEDAGDLTASGSVISTTMLQQTGDDGKKSRVRSIARAADFVYEEAQRRGTYTGKAHVFGPQGDMRAGRIELYLLPTGDELDHVEAYEQVILVESGRTTTGSRMTYLAADDRYEVTGTPVTIIDECGQKMEGRKATKLKDRVILDGNERLRTRTEGNNKCP
jgi:LPS export ABC transporter protein LptC